MFSLENRLALLTGASGGIGNSIAHKLVNAGATVVISGTREDALNKLEKELKGDSYSIVCNLSDNENIDSLVDFAEEKAGKKIDILINNAGITRDNLAVRMRDEEWREVIDINLFASFRLMRRSLKSMMKERFGRIISISSVVGLMGNAGQANYVASKAGLIGLTKSMALEVASRGITVNCVAPGFVKTNMTSLLTDSQKESIMEKIPMKRMGLVNEIANAVIFLASDESGYISGQTLHVNGGMYMQ